MPGYVAPLGKFIAFTNGSPTFAPLAGGKVYTYQAGTSTPTPTYTTALLNIQNSNPVILDSAGRASIFIPDASVMTYKFVVQDSAGVQVYSEDNISIPVVPAAPSAGNVPTGAIFAFGGNTAPSGFLLCDGSLVSRTTYSGLWTVLQSGQYGTGDGSSTFQLPDLRQKFPMGVAASGTYGSPQGKTGGTFDHQHTAPDHTHTIPDHDHPMPHKHLVPYNGWSTVSQVPAAGQLQAGGSGVGSEATVTQATASQLSGDTNTANTSLKTGLVTNLVSGGAGLTAAANPPFQTVNYIIKT